MMKIGCVLMAAGTASRFGENKLLYPVGGKTLIERALFAAPASLFARAVAVVSDARVEAAARDAGYACIWNPTPERGQGASIALGAIAMEGMDAALFCVADQPFLRRESVARLIEASKSGIFVALSFGGSRGNPVIFPADSFAALRALRPDQTGKAVLAANADRIVLVEAEDGAELKDIDRKSDLQGV